VQQCLSAEPEKRPSAEAVHNQLLMFLAVDESDDVAESAEIAETPASVARPEPVTYPSQPATYYGAPPKTLGPQCCSIM
jgi:hypothetical protein